MDVRPAENTPADAIQTEAIPDGDAVHRHLFAPRMGSFDAELHWQNVFLFKTEQQNKQSVVWGRYATIEDVHALGCVKQVADRGAGKTTTYIGAISAQVDAVRAIRLATVSADVEHDPSGNQGRHHAVIRLVIAEGINPKSGTCKAERAAMSLRLKDAFTTNHPHACPENVTAQA